MRIGQSEDAVASFERAITRKPARADLLEISQTLGRVHQRAQRTEAAMQVWQRLEAQFPDDPRVLEQIAVTLSEEGQPAESLARYQKLAELVRDDYRRVIYEVTAAELTIKTGQREAGITALEKVLSDLNPESWLYRDVRRRIEDVFMRSGDQDSLVKYYQRWLEDHPEDVEGMTRLARFLATSARVPEATEWMEKALKLAPSRTDLRKAFIDQLVNDQRFGEAAAQYKQLVEAAPGNPDFLRDWGKLVLRNKEVQEADRKKEAINIWNQILATRPDDALTVSQVADLFRQNKMTEQAEQLYRKAVELSDSDPQYREYLGEFLHVQKRSEEALVVWAGIAAGDRRNAINLTRLAEVYNSFGFPEKAIVEIADAVKLDSKDFSLQIRSADYHAKAGKYEDAMNYVDAANALAASDDERDAVIQQRIEVLQASQQLDTTADALLVELRTRSDATVADWYLAARYLEAGRRWPDASEAIDNAIGLDPKSIPAMTVAARIAETSGDYGRAAEMNRTLAEIDRRSRGDHLMNVSRLEAQLGRTDEALEAAQQLIVSAPGNTDNYEFYAQMCFRLGKSDDGLEALRKAVRINPNEPHLIMSLGAALAEQLRTDEAIEVYWRAFEKSEDVEDKVGLTMKLAPLYQQINQFDKLVDRFERDRREEDKRREMTICLAQAWHTFGDISAARQELESLLSEDTRDTNLLNQLAKLCQSGADLDAAIGYQRQLVAIAPGHETEFPLAGMLMANSQLDEAREIFVKLTQREEDPVRQIKSLDSLLTQGNYESVIGVIDPLLAQNRDDWELLYREGVAWASLEKSDEAINRFQRILALNLPYDALGRSAEAKLQQAQAKAKSDNLRGITTSVPQRQSPLAMRSMSSQVQRSSGLVADNRYYGSGQSPPVWSPEAYGVARMAAFAWLMRFEEEAAQAKDAPASTAVAESAPAESVESIVDAVTAKAEADNASRESIYDLLYVAQLKNDYRTVFEISRRLAKAGGKEEQQFFLSSLNLRSMDVNQATRSSSVAAAAKTPLGEDDLQLVRDCYQQLNSDSNSVDLSAIYGGNIAYASNGQAYIQIGGRYTMLAGVFRDNAGGYLNTFIEELRLAGQNDEARELLDQKLQAASSAGELAAAMGLLLKEEREDELLEYFDRWQQAALQQIADAPVTAPGRGSSRRSSRSASQTAGANVLPMVQNTIQQWMDQLGVAEENARVLSILDGCLKVAAAEAKHRRLVQAAQTRRTRASIASSPIGRVSIYQGKKQTTANVDFPPLGTWFNNSACSLLYQAHDVLKRNDVAADLNDLLQKRLQNPAADSGDVDMQLCNTMYLASALWWSDEQDAAVDLMASAATLAADDLSMQFSLSNMYLARGDFEDALNVIETIVPRDQRVLQQKELQALQLAERLGDTDRARAAAERLFGLRLDAQTQLSLVDRMRRLGLSGMADAILARAERTATNQTSSLASLMMLYQSQGKTDQATQLAHMLLRKTPSPIAINNRSSRNPTRYRTTDSNLRTQALQLLQQSGAMKGLIEQLEAQLKRSPDSLLPLQQLIEFYGVTAQKEEALQVLQQALGVRPDSPILLLTFAKQLAQVGKHSEACDQYLELLKVQPDWVTDDLYQIDRVFTQAKRQTDLVNGLSEINMKRISQPHYIINTASRLLQNESSLEAGLTLLERAFEAFPQYRQNLVQNLRSPAVWKNDRVYEFAKRAVLPSTQDIQANPWMGLDQISSYSGNGEVNVFFHQMLQGLKATDKLKDLEASISELLDQQPGWHSGSAMLALLELNSDRKSEAQARLQKLADNEELIKTMPAEACWIIGQELDRFEETRDLAMTLFERAMSAPSQNSMNQLQYSPVSKLIDGYIRVGRKEEARTVLLKQLSASTYDQYDQDYSSYQRIQNSQWAAQKLLTMEAPVDAVRLYQQLLNNPESLAAANRFHGNGDDYYEKTVRSGLAKALASVTSENADDAIAQLLVVPETLKPGTPAIELMLDVPNASSLAKEPIRSSYVELLKSLSKERTIADNITVRISQMAAQHPHDLSIAIAMTAWSLEMKHADAAEAVKNLVALATDHPLESIPEGRRPNSRQRREAGMLIPLWLVARQCLATDDLHEQGTRLAEMCSAAAARQMGTKERSAILYDWGDVLMKAGHKEEAEARWSELLDMATERPSRRKAEPKTGQLPRDARAKKTMLTRLLLPQTDLSAGRSKPPTASDRAQSEASTTELIPPLTLSQFRVAIVVAKSAAQNGMPQLSRKAVQESLKGGFPVADPVAADLSGNQRRVVRSSSSGSAVDPIEAEVVSSLKEIVALWKGEEYPAAETYALLKLLVLPENQPQEIRMYVTATNISEAQVESLAEALVHSAAAASQMEDLATAIATRQSNTARIPNMVLNSLISLNQDNVQQAEQDLNELNSLLQNGIPSNDQQVVFLAAVRAFQTPTLKPAAFPILRQILQLDLQASSAGNRQPQLDGKLATMVNQYLSETGDQKSVRDYFESVMASRQAYYSRFSGDYGLQMQWRDLGTMSQQAANLKMPDLALEFLGRACDFDVANSSRPNMATSLASVVRHLRTLPAAQRYEQWRAWTMPIEGRQTLRVLYETYSPTQVPLAFATADHPLENQLDSRVLSNLAELVDAAKQADTLNDLRKEVQALADANVSTADILLALTLIAQDDVAAGVPLVHSLQDSFRERMKPEDGSSRSQRPVSHGDYLVFQAALQSEGFVHIFEDRLPEFRKQLQDTSQHEMLQVVNRDWASRVSSKAMPDANSPGSQFSHWTPVNSSEGSGNRRPWWAVYDDQLVQINGFDGSDLYFRYPLTGNFTMSVDCYDNSWAECDAAYGGVIAMAQNWSSRTTVRSVSGHESITRPPAMKRSRPVFNTMTIEVADGTVRHLLNNHLVYEEPATATSPWLFLHTEGSRISAFRNVRISGDAVIPPSVSLIDGDRMDGWNCSFFGDSQPRRRLMAETPKDPNDSLAYSQRREPTEFSWNANNGILHGSVLNNSTDDQQSWIYYQRPLTPGDTFEYEFFYTPGQMVAHPTIGRIALLLKPDGVQSHWLASTSDASLNNIPPKNLIVEDGIRRGPEKLSLKDNDWNHVQLRLQDNVAVVTLNGTVVCERPLEPELSRRFGLFRYRTQSSQVRNLKLTGNWLDILPTGDDLLALEQPDTPESVLEIATILDDAMIIPLADEVVLASRSMAADAAFDYLVDWVLPSSTHQNIRLDFSQTPATTAADDGKVAADSDADATTSQSDFGQILCPAAELVRVAVRDNKLETVGAFIDQYQPNTPLQQRSVNALKTLVAIEVEADQVVAEMFRNAWSVVDEQYPKGTPARERLPEFVMAWRAGQHPKYWAWGSDIADRLRNMERNDHRSNDSHFNRYVHSLVGDISSFAQSLAATPALETSQWTSVPYWKPEQRFHGYRPSTWSVTKGVALHTPAETWSQLYFQSPLKGQFEIVANRTTHGHKEVSIAWGMHSAEPRYDLKAVRVAKVMHSSREVATQVKLPMWDQQADFRIVVDGRKVTTWTNGIQVHEEIFATDPDPWLLLQSHSPEHEARISGLKILGTPDIPSEIDLLNVAGMASWRADVYGEWFRTEGDNDNNSSVPWNRVGDELIGQLDQNTNSEHRESLILYQRPMLEDGVIEFETWYEPGKFEVHPALGRLAFVLTADGVQLHRLTDAQYETNGLSAGNLQPIPDAAENLDLKAKDWNHVRLTLKGDQVTIAVNGTDAATVMTSDPVSERQFGLFRWSNKTQCRVRKVLYRGEWPKTLPAVAEQQLAPATQETMLPNSQVTADYDLSQPMEKLKSMKVTLRGPQDRRRTVADGLELQLHDSKTWGDHPSISWKQPIAGDCEITVDYRDAKLVPQKTGWGVSFAFYVSLDDDRKTRVECSVSLNSERQLQHRSHYFRNRPTDESKIAMSQFLHPGNASGQLRLLRRGGRIDCFAAPANSGEFVLLNSIPVGAGNIKEVVCMGKASDDVGQVNVTLKRLTIRQVDQSAVTSR